MNARHEDVPLADIPRYTWLLSRYPNFLASFIRPFREVAVRRFCLAIEQRLALMAAVLGMIARQGQPKSMPVVIAMATIAASQLKLLLRVLRYLAAYCRGTKDLVYRGYGLRRPWLVVQGRRS